MTRAKTKIVDSSPADHDWKWRTTYGVVGKKIMEVDRRHQNLCLVNVVSVVIAGDPFWKKLWAGWKAINETMLVLGLEYVFSSLPFVGHHAFVQSCKNRFCYVLFWMIMYSMPQILSTTFCGLFLIIGPPSLWYLLSLNGLNDSETHKSFSNGLITIRHGAQRNSFCFSTCFGRFGTIDCKWE